MLVSDLGSFRGTSGMLCKNIPNSKNESQVYFLLFTECCASDVQTSCKLIAQILSDQFSPSLSGFRTAETCSWQHMIVQPYSSFIVDILTGTANQPERKHICISTHTMHFGIGVSCMPDDFVIIGQVCDCLPMKLPK